MDIVNRHVQIVEFNRGARLTETKRAIAAKTTFRGVCIEDFFEGYLPMKVNGIVAGRSKEIHVKEKNLKQHGHRKQRKDAKSNAGKIVLMLSGKIEGILGNMFNRLHN